MTDANAGAPSCDFCRAVGPWIDGKEKATTKALEFLKLESKATNDHRNNDADSCKIAMVVGIQSSEFQSQSPSTSL